MVTGVFPSGEKISSVFDTLPAIDLMGSDSDVRLWESFAIKRYENLNEEGPNILSFYRNLIEFVVSCGDVRRTIADEMWELAFTPIAHVLVAEWNHVFTFSRYNSWGNIDHHWRKGSVIDSLYREMQLWLGEETTKLQQRTEVKAINMIPFNASINLQSHMVEVTDLCKNVRDLAEYV